MESTAEQVVEGGLQQWHTALERIVFCPVLSADFYRALYLSAAHMVSLVGWLAGVAGLTTAVLPFLVPGMTHPCSSSLFPEIISLSSSSFFFSLLSLFLHAWQSQKKVTAMVSVCLLLFAVYGDCFHRCCW